MSRNFERRTNRCFVTAVRAVGPAIKHVATAIFFGGEQNHGRDEFPGLLALRSDRTMPSVDRPGGSTDRGGRVVPVWEKNTSKQEDHGRPANTPKHLHLVFEVPKTQN